MKDYFSYFGGIEHAFIVSDENERSLGYGFIEFQTPSSVDMVQEQRPHSIKERELQISRGYPRNIPTRLKKPSTVLYVSHYDDHVDEKNIEEYFTQFGDIIYVSCEIKRPLNIKFMEIHFDDYDAVDMICLTNNHTINGSTVTVSKYLENNSEKLLNQQQANVSTTNLSQKPEDFHQHIHHDHFGNQQQRLYQSEQQPAYSSSTNLHRQESENNNDDCCVIL